MKIYSPIIIENLFNDSRFDILNKIVSSEQNRSLDYYSGMIEDTFVGPIKSIIAGAVLLCFCLIYYKSLTFWKFSFLIFLYFLVTRHEVLFYPPYGDAIIGPFSDAVWLFRHSLDYRQMLLTENFTTGGPIVYPTSFYPLLLAVLMKITKTSANFLIVAHSLVFLISAVIISLLRKLAERLFDDRLAMICSLMILSLPLYQSMSELINMEMPCLLFAVLSIYFLSQKRILLAAVFSVLALAVKAPGAIVCATVFVGGVLLAINEKEKKNAFKKILIGILPVLIAAVSGSIRSSILGTQISYNKLELFIGLKNILSLSIFWIYLLVFSVYVVRFVICKLDENKGFQKIRAFCNINYISIIIIVLNMLWFLLYANFSVMLYRYQLLVMPFFVLAIILTVSYFISNKKLLEKLLLVAVLMLFLGAHGLYYDHSEDYYQGCNEFERSLEYRNDLKLQKKMAKIFEDKYSDKVISSSILIAQILNFKEIGYVSKDFDVIVYSMKGTHEGMGTYKGLDQVDILNTIWAGFPRDTIDPGFIYPAGNKDLILHHLFQGNKEVVIFMGGYQIETMRIIYNRVKSMKEKQLHK